MQNVKHWNSRIKTFFTDLEVGHLNDIEHTTNQPAVMEYMNPLLEDYYEQVWWEDPQRQEALRGRGHNTLWTYKKKKNTFSVEHYLRNIMSKKYRSAFAKFRCGVAPVRIETGRYEGMEEKK